MPRKQEKGAGEIRFLARLFPRFRLALIRSDYEGRMRIGSVFKKLHLFMYRYAKPVKYPPKR